MEQFNHKDQISALQEKIGQYLIGIAPLREKLCLYAKVSDASVDLWLLMVDWESDRLPMVDAETNDTFWEYCDDDPSADRSRTEQRLSELVLALHRAYQEQRGEENVWRILFCTVTPNHTVRFEFEYADVSVNQAVINAAVRKQGCPEPVQPLEPVPVTEMIRSRQAALEQYLISIMPVPWKKICLFAHFSGGRLTAEFAVLEAETDTVCSQHSFQRIYANAGYYVPGRDEMKRKVNQLTASIYFYCAEDWGKENAWRSMFFTITPDGSSHMEFAWAPFTEQDDPYMMERAAFEIFFGGA